MTWKDEVAKGWGLLHYDGEVQWFAKKELPKRTLGGRLRSLDALIGTVRNAEALTWDLYLNANPTRPRLGATKLRREDVIHWRYLVVDLDPTDAVLAPPQPTWPWTANRIFSGRGYQFWLPQHEWYRIEPHPHAERMMGGYLRHLTSGSEQWAAGWKVDTTCSDLARVVRCPGSINQKTGKRAVVEDTAAQEPRFKAEDIEPYIVAEPEPPTAQFANSANLMEVLPHLNGRAKEFILYGVESPGRHSACYATCKSLHELGVGLEVAEAWLRRGASICYRPSWDLEGPGTVLAPLAAADVTRIIKQIYGGR